MQISVDKLNEYFSGIQNTRVLFMVLSKILLNLNSADIYKRLISSLLQEDFKGAYQKMTPDEETSIFDALSEFARLGEKLRQISDEKSARFLMDVQLFAAKRGLLLPESDFKMILENCSGKDLAELLVYRLVNPFIKLLARKIKRTRCMLNIYEFQLISLHLEALMQL